MAKMEDGDGRRWLAKDAGVWHYNKSFKWYEYEQERFWTAHRHPPDVRTLMLVPGPKRPNAGLNTPNSINNASNLKGEDIRNNFVGHLWKALDQAGVRTFMDSKELRKGEGISPLITRAIKESRVAVIIFLESYASSPWSLEELAQILECKKMKEQDSERVKKWREALVEAANLSGWHLDNGDESSLIESITKEISVKLGTVPLHVLKHPVGIDHRVEKVELLLRMELSDAHMVGIWGTGGIGKTTIAKAVYNALHRQFVNRCFLNKVGETSKNHGMVHLQKELLHKMLRTKGLEVSSVDAGINLIRDRLCCKEVLLVLDDATDMDQLDALAGECDWFGKGSRVIITTRDKHLLTSHTISEIYEVKPLNHTESLELLSSHAFPRGEKMEMSRDLVDDVLRYANGLPLALVVLGSFFNGRSKDQWKSALNKLAEHPNEMINNVLKISFEALDDQQKEIFLDIEIRFLERAKGRERERVGCVRVHPPRPRCPSAVPGSLPLLFRSAQRTLQFIPGGAALPRGHLERRRITSCSNRPP
ncbi:disease resistance protein Roq1-like [Syzygium oleosum]|uniref:disease resistance protein Roq1-like n=1 Tax=Syzygium oleosum TaxID=219896 RepID=UPI0024BB7A9D|nr:disease resistance protein Roq1-like [Syzygium oleosum]